MLDDQYRGLNRQAVSQRAGGRSFNQLPHDGSSCDTVCRIGLQYCCMYNVRRQLPGGSIQ